MTCHGELRLEFPDERAARVAEGAIAPDDPDVLQVRRAGATLVLQAASTTRLGWLRTVDDALGCLRAIGVE